MKLPTYEDNHYILDDAEAINAEYPDSFSIPDRAIRYNLKPGDIVKLIFRMELINDSESLSVERMWVTIRDTDAEFYTGILDNEPNGKVHVEYGQIFYFKPVHVIDVYNQSNT